MVFLDQTSCGCMRKVSEQSYYRGRGEYGGLNLEQARRMKDLEKESVPVT